MHRTREVWSISEIGSQLAKAWFEKEGNLTVQLDGGLALGGLLEVHCHLRAWPWLDKSNEIPWMILAAYLLAQAAAKALTQS